MHKAKALNEKLYTCFQMGLALAKKKKISVTKRNESNKRKTLKRAMNKKASKVTKK